MSWRGSLLTLAAFGLIIGLGACKEEAVQLVDLSPGQEIEGFRLVNLYVDGAERVMGARFQSESHGFLVDLLRIQSVPQGFMWIKTIPWSDRGEAHACEHLLLGKGRQGRYVAALEEMTLGSSSAWTSQLNTVYHFNTLAGRDGFYQTLEARLGALLNPDFTDEEIRREVRHLGVAENPADSSLFLEEKGTVYTEMVSSFEGPGYPLWMTMGSLLFGSEHPQANSSGGQPDSMMSMTPEHLREFHRDYYRPANMGIIASIPDDMNVDEFLRRTSEILQKTWPQGDASPHPGMGAYELPRPQSAEPGRALLEPYASENDADPCRVLLGWPAHLQPEAFELFLLDYFVSALAGGPGTRLYDRFINSETRVVETGADRVGAYVESEPGYPLYLELTGIEAQKLDEDLLRRIRSLVMEEIRNLHELPGDAPELAAFNREVGSRLAQGRKQYARALDSPPMFGFRRGSAGYWQELLGFLELDGDFNKSLVLDGYFAAADSVLQQPGNIWRSHIQDWRLLEVPPYAVGVYPDPTLIESARVAKEERLLRARGDLVAHYGEVEEQEAIARYRAEFDENTEELAAIAATETMPRFIENPPLTLDDQLDYQVLQLPAGEIEVDLVASTFDNMSSATLGLALRLDVLPESHLLALPLIPDLLTSAGVTKDGERIDYAQMQDRLRREILSYSARFDFGAETGRIELVLSGGASRREEIASLLGWMEASLFAPTLSEDNLPRLRDIVDQSLAALRSTMQRSEEAWVSGPALAYRFQTNPLVLATQSFLTQEHYYHRLKWLLADAGGELNQAVLDRFLEALAAEGEVRDRAGLMALLEDPPSPPGLKHADSLAGEIILSLQAALAGIPDANLTGDWAYLCDEIGRDLRTPPARTLDLLRESLDMIRAADGARLYMISSGGDRRASLPLIEGFVAKLSSTPRQAQNYEDSPRILDRLRSRVDLVEAPTYVGLVNESTRNGVLLFSARTALPWDAREEKVLDCITGRLYGGGGGHGLFMRTWAAGLAYSNGYSYRSAQGRVSYYAERCPDVAQTMGFVVDILAMAEVDEALVEYAFALCFGSSRAAGPYEMRGQAMAADLADGFGPERVRKFREEILVLRQRENLAPELQARIPRVYGQTLAGLGPPLTASEEGVFFLIGPEIQFASLEEYIAAVETAQRVQRLYARDFWLVEDPARTALNTTKR